ncbi:MAG: GGDEF domain-containing protein [Brevinematia bacterium]
MEDLKSLSKYEKFLTREFVNNLKAILEEFQKDSKKTLEIHKEFFREITEVIFSVNLPDEELVQAWEEILSEKINSEKDLRALALNYLLSRDVIRNPKILELDRFLKLTNLASKDPKTDIYNYTTLKIIIEKEIYKANRYGGFFSILMIDLDNFKHYNDTYGHQLGDQILKDFVTYISSCLRKSDMIFRYGGDEFVIFLPETRRIGARVVAEKIREITLKKFSERDIKISVSIGIAVFPYDGETYEELILFADKMLYASKGKGKNTITDKLDNPEEIDSTKTPSANKNFELVLNYNDHKVKCTGLNINKSGMLVKQNYPIVQGTNEIVELEEIKLNHSTYLLNIPIKVKRAEGEFIELDFSENKTLETLVYLLEDRY